MNTKRAGPKSHHYVPASYLARFADSHGFVHVHDRAREQVRRQRPNKLMKIDAYYRQEWAPVGVDVNILENFLGAGVEAKAPAILDKIAHTNDALVEDEAIDFLLYLEVQRIRVPRQAIAGVELMRTAVLQSMPAEIAEDVRAGRAQITMKDLARWTFA